MDLAKDILRLSEKVAQVPGLSTACSLAFQIIKTVQISKNNTARLQYLAHFVSDHLVSIADNMQGRWDDAPPTLKEHMDEFEAVLRNATKVVTKYSTTSRVMALINAGDREMDITRLEKHLGDTQRAILLLLGVNTSLAVSRVQSVVNSHHRLGLETHSRLSRLENTLHQTPWRPEPNHSKQVGAMIYTRDSLRLLQKITRRLSYVSAEGSQLTVTVHQAERCIDGRMVLVKTYEGSDQIPRMHAFMNDLTVRTHFWDSLVLQIIGASDSSECIPFQVYHSPSGQLSSFENWVFHTLHSNTVETICGLYDMRTSIKALLEFQKHRSVRCDYNIFSESIVSFRACGNSTHCSLIYTGELETGKSWGTIQTQDVYRKTNDIYYNTRDGQARTVAAFCEGSTAWAEDTRCLQDVVKCDNDVMDIVTLSSTLFDCGWFGTCWDSVSTHGNIGLGDVGYMQEDGMFVVLTNLHTHLRSRNRSLPDWSSRRSPDPDTYFKNLDIVGGPQGSYKRYHDEQAPPLWPQSCTLGYEDLDQKKAWKLLQHHACEIITRSALPIAPHELRLVSRVRKYLWVWRDRCILSDEAIREANRMETPLPDCVLSESGPCSRTSGYNAVPPTLYVFEGGEGVRFRATGAPELTTRMRASFAKEPIWLGEESWRETDGVEIKDGFYLKYYIDCRITYFQLPIGVELR